MNHRRVERQLVPSRLQTRCVREGDVHEFISHAPVPGDGPINDVSYLGFGTFTASGVVAVSDALAGIGVVSGFDETHMPNHLNILVQVTDPATGCELGMTAGDAFAIVPALHARGPQE